MDINLARTFIEIVNAGSFVSAANRMNLTQSTVSSRIRTLEEHLGRRLFIRNRSGATLTPAGEQFHRYAVSLTQVWEQACHDMAVPTGFTGVLGIGGQASLWDGLLLDWLDWLGDKFPLILVRAEYGQPDRLMARLAEGMIDAAIMYAPESRPGLKIKKLFSESLVLVSATSRSFKRGDREYVFADWGPEFRRWHSLNFPTQHSPRLHLALGTHGVNYLLERGGSGYFPKRAVSRHLSSGQLEQVKHTPTFPLPVYLVYATEHDKDSLGAALSGLRQIVAQVTADHGDE